MKISLFLGSVITLLGAPILRATELYNLDFAEPEVGTYQTWSGFPSIEPSVGPFTDAMVFEAKSVYEQIRLPISLAGPRYDIHFDAIVHGLTLSEYAFTVVLDTPQVRTVRFDGEHNTIRVLQPGLEPFPSFVNERDLAPFVNDQVYHFDITVDFQVNLWSIAVDGTELFSHAVNATGLQSIRFNMGDLTPDDATGLPGTYAALDNVVVNVVPEPSSLFLCLVAFITLLPRHCVSVLRSHAGSPSRFCVVPSKRQKC